MTTPCTFTYDGKRQFDGFDDGTRFRGLAGVSVTPAVRDDLVAYLELIEPGLDYDDLREMRSDAQGLISLSRGYAPRFVSGLKRLDGPTALSDQPDAITLGEAVARG
jgi:hypothetical protein